MTHRAALCASWWSCTVMPALFQLYCYTRRSPTSLKATVTSIMDTFFLVSEGSATGKALRDLILPPSPDASTSSFALAFAPGPTGGGVIKRTKNPRYACSVSARVRRTVTKPAACGMGGASAAVGTRTGRRSAWWRSSRSWATSS